MKILVVEDSKIDAEQLTTACQQSGFQTSLADSGEKALEMVWTWKPDMLLLDLLMFTALLARLDHVDPLGVVTRRAVVVAHPVKGRLLLYAQCSLLIVELA